MGQLQLLLQTLMTLLPKLLELWEKKRSSIPASPPSQTEKPSNNLPYKHLIQSDFAKKLGIDNTPDEKQIKNLQQLNIKIYTPIKLALEKIGRLEWLRITSGFRSEKLNKAVGGSPNSDHMAGLALDIVCFDNEFLFDLIKNLNLPFKQLIKEDNGKSQWIHVSLDLNDIPKKQCLEAYMDNGIMKYRSI